MSIYDLAYQSLLTLALPVLLVRPRLRQKLARARRERNGDVPPREGDGPCVLIHAVSVGEVNATRPMVVELLEGASEAGRPTGALSAALQVVVSVTTETGFARARQLFETLEFAERVNVVRYPLDLSGCVRRFLDRLRPSVAVLMELEVWPNFLRECNRREIPVLLVNGRMTERSYRSYRRIRPLVRRMFASLTAVCAQEQAYAERFIDLGVPPERVGVTGTMKFDSAPVGDRVEGDEELAAELGLRPRALGGDEPVLVCGSTGPREESLLVEMYARLRERHPALRIAIIPRKPERFDEVARYITAQFEWPLIRRSSPSQIDPDPAVKVFGAELARENPEDYQAIRQRAAILGDTMGELRKFYSLADVVFVGRTLVDLGEKQHGSDMIEPAALGKPVVVGPYTQNFAEPMRALLAGDAIRQVRDAPEPSKIEQLSKIIDTWLRDPAGAEEVGRRAREVVRRQRGATRRHVELIRSHLPASI